MNGEKKRGAGGRWREPERHMEVEIEMKVTKKRQCE